MVDLNKVTTDRRKFLKFFIIGLLSVAYTKNLSIQSSEKNIIHLEEKEIKFINAYNKKRISALRNNIEEAIMFNNVHEGIHFGYILAQRKS